MHHSASSSFYKARRSLYKKQNFIPFLQKESFEQGCSSSEFRDGSGNPHISMTEDSKELLQNGTNNGSFGVVSVFWSKRWAQEYCRKMLLKTYDDSLQEGNDGQSPEKKVGEFVERDGKVRENRKNSDKMKVVSEIQSIRLHTKIQIGQDQKREPINWIYFEIDLDGIASQVANQTSSKRKTEQKLIELSILMSSYVFFEIPVGQQNPNVLESLKGIVSRFGNSQELEQSSILLMSDHNYSPRSFDFDRSQSLSVNSTFLQKEGKNSSFPELIILHSEQNGSCHFEELERLLIQKNVRNSFIDIGRVDDSVSIGNGSGLAHSLSLSPMRRALSFNHTDGQESQKSKRQIKPEVIQQILKNAKKFTHKMAAKRNPFDGSSVTGNLLIAFVQEFLIEITIRREEVLSSMSVNQIWLKVITSEEKRIFEKCMELYEEKFKDLAMGKTVISQDLFEQAHKRAKQTSLAFYQKNSTSVKGAIAFQKLDSALKQKEKEKRQYNFRGNLQWGKQLLTSSYQSIDRKIKSKEIRSFGAFKQEIILFREFFRKKCQQQCASQTPALLSDYFETFILDRIFEGFSSICGQERQAFLKELQERKAMLKSYENMSRDLKRKSGKEQSELNARLSSLSERNQYLKMHEELLEKTNEKLRTQLEELSAKIGSKFGQQELQIQEEMSRLRRRNLEVGQQLEDAERRGIILESENRKERMLHEQTQKNYSEILGEQRVREEQLSSRLEIISIHSKSDLSDANFPNLKRNTSQEDILDQTRGKRNAQIRDLKRELKIRSEQLNILKKKNHQLTLEFGTKLEHALREKDDSEIQMRVMEQKLLESESRMPRHRKLEEEFERLQKLREETMENQQKFQKEIALLEQRIRFLSEKLEEERGKTEQFNLENESLKAKNEQYYQRIRASMRNSVDEWVQVEDLSFKNKLKEALGVVEILEKEYTKLKVELNRVRGFSRN